MKKLLFIGTLLLVIAACSGTSKEDAPLGALVNRGDEKIQLYYVVLEAEDGDKTKKGLSFILI